MRWLVICAHEFHSMSTELCLRIPGGIEREQSAGYLRLSMTDITPSSHSPDCGAKWYRILSQCGLDWSDEPLSCAQDIAQRDWRFVSHPGSSDTLVGNLGSHAFG